MAAQLEGPPAPPEPLSAPPPPLPPSPATPAPSPRFKIALYRDQLATSPVPINATWDEFVDFLTTYVEESPCTVAPGPAKCIGKECPHKSYSSLPDNDMAWSPTEIVGNRLDVNVRALTLLALDFDHVSAAEAAGVVARLASYEHALHTTHNHRVEDICFRAILALSRPVHANQWHRFLAAAIGFLGVTILQTGTDGKQHRQPDPTCKNRSRFYYRPSHPKDAPHDAKRVRGRILDVDEVLAWAAANAPVEDPQTRDGQRVFPEVSDWDLESEAVLDAIDVVVRYFPDRRRHELALALGGMLRARGAALDDARYIIRETFRQGGSKNPDARAATVDHTYGLSEESFMTGFTRVAEILGEDVARELGDHLTDACNEAFLRSVIDAPERASSSAAIALPGALATPPPPAPIALGELRQEISGLATRRMRSHERDDRIVSLLLRRALEGEALARPGGHGDVETVLDGATRGIGRRAALERVTRALAFSLPPSTPWSAVREILRASIASMEPA